MASRNSDVTLIVRARDEAQKTIDNVTGALNKLLGVQQKVSGSAADTGSNIAELGKILATLDKAYSSISGSAATAATAFERQRSAISEQRQQLAAVQQQATAAAAAMAKLNSADAVVGAGRDQSGRLAQLKLVTSEYERLQREAGKLATSIARQEDAFGTSASSLQRVSSQANAVEDAVTRARVAIEAQTRALKEQATAAAVVGRVNSVTGVDRPRAVDNGATFSALDAREQEIALRAAAQAHQQFEARVRQGAAAMREEARAADELEGYVRDIREQIDPLARSERYLAEQQAKLNAALKAGKISASEYDQALKLVNQSSKQLRDKPQVSLFGLRPYETQNLMFQFNDIATQLASGTSLTQTLAQQGGQILQLFPKVGASIAAGLTSAPVLGFTAALGLLVLGLNRAADSAERLRQVNATLDVNANGGDYNAAKVDAAAKAFERYGISAEDAIKIVRTFVQNGLPEERFLSFGKTAENLSKTLGTDVVDAARQLATAFNGTYEGIATLDNATNLLTASERQRVQSLFEQGKAQEAMRVAYDAMAGRLEKGAQDMRGPWADAARAITTAWSGFLDVLANSKIVETMTQSLADLANGVTRVLNRLAGATTIRDIDTEIEQLQRRIESLNNTRILAGESGSIGRRVGDIARDMQIDEAIAKIKELQKEREKLLGANGDPAASGSTAGFGENPQLKKQSDEALKSMTREQQLQTLREKGAKSVNNLRTRNEQFLTEAEKRRREALAGELAATKAIGDQRVKDAARAQAIQEERSRIQQEQDSFNASANTPQMLARQFVAGREGFRSKAYWDVNAFRVGFGSDTKTSADGSVSAVTQNTTVTLEDAIRDLDRRIGEFQNAIKATIGAERFNSFSPQQQAAITSIAYNYGKLPDRIVAAVRSGTSAEIATAIEGLGGDNKGVNRSRRNLEASTFRTANVALEQNTVNQAEDQAAAQQKFNSEIESGNRKLEQRTRLLNEQAGLQGEALLKAQAQAAADEAELNLRERLKQINEQRLAQHKEALTLSEAEVAATRKAASDAVLNQRALAEARLNDVNRPVEDLSARRDALQAQLQLQQSLGNGNAVEGLQNSLRDVNAELAKALEAKRLFLEDPGNAGLLETLGLVGDKLQATLTGLQNATLGTQQWVNVLGISGQTIAQNLSSGLAGAFDQFAQSVANGANAFKSLGDAFRQFAANFLRQIAQMIIQQLLFNLISGLFKSAVGGAGGGTAVAGVQAHAGGVIGSGSFVDSNPNRTWAEAIGGIFGDGRTGPFSGPRIFNTDWLRNARRYHTGGIAGLAPNEVPAVLMRGEEVLTADDPRHRANGGGAGAAPQIKVINAIDAGDMVQQGMNTKAGEQAFLNFIRNNPGAVRGAMGG